MKKAILINLVCMAFTINVQAANKSSQCQNLKKCASIVSSMTGMQYIFPNPFKGKVESTRGIKLDSKNADLLYSHMLNENGYTRVLLGDKKTYRIISTRDVRYNSVPQVTSDISSAPLLPDTADYYMMTYQLKNTIVGNVITRSLRPFMSRYGRIIENKMSGTLIVQDTALNLNRLYGLIKSMDKEPSRDLLNSWKEDKKQREKIELAKAKFCGDKNNK